MFRELLEMLLGEEGGVRGGRENVVCAEDRKGEVLAVWTSR